MTREEAISEWTFRSNHIKKWLDEYGEEPSIRHYVELIDMAIEALSAEAKPTVIRSKTLLPTKDFKEWAKRVRDGNPNVIVIPCDAEVVSAEAAQGEWIWRTDIPIGDGRTSAGYICSNCGKDYWHGNVFNYCPSCGARMKGGAE